MKQLGSSVLLERQQSFTVRFEVQENLSGMASVFSADIFLETCHVLVMFLKDGAVYFLHDYDSKGRRYESGEFIDLVRNKLVSGFQSSDHESDTDDFATESVTLSEPELAVVLGWGETHDETVNTSKDYIRQVARVHGDTDEFELTLFGYDLSQSEVFQ